MNTFGTCFSVFMGVSYAKTGYYNILLVSNCRSVDCFKLGWPMRADADFFYQPSKELEVDKDKVCCNFRYKVFFLPLSLLLIISIFIK